ncbi:hypothetical protein SteCoe_34355 [Stentor coeruleus]|uniref:Core Histone H2A/H2B/H3 domain-containing protein n=1 Tax=Stentor coeruleus TaxID=5963 RepID=A0A1R2AUP4_9CILI|nr:hypothetical protein SteCoe_34355 [Stentor coeruleus]
MNEKKQENKGLLSSSPVLELSKRSFKRAVSKISVDKIWSKEALEALQLATEVFLTKSFADSLMCAEHANRITVTVKDIQLARRISGIIM